MDKESTPVVALRKAVLAAGSQSKVARMVGVSQQAVWKWLHNEKWLPGEHVLTVERETGVSRHELRPDLYPIETADSGVVAMEPLR